VDPERLPRWLLGLMVPIGGATLEPLGRSIARRPVASAAPVRAVTRGPNHHFFGYYDKCPWSPDGRRLLVTEVKLFERMPGPGDRAGIGVVHLEDDDRLEIIDTTPAWCWQLGALAQWLGEDGATVVYNSVADGRYISVVRDLDGGAQRTLPGPVFAVSAAGDVAISLSFERLARVRPGYGYEALDVAVGGPAPDDDGLFAIDVASGARRQLVSLRQLAEQRPSLTSAGAMHWVNAPMLSPSARHVLFLHRWTRPGGVRSSRLYVAALDGGEPRLLLDRAVVSHYDWLDDDRILVWASTSGGRRCFQIVHRDGRPGRTVGVGVLTRDGHATVSPDGRWLVGDSYPGLIWCQQLWLYRLADGRRFDVGRFAPPFRLLGANRCDLHPRWDRTGCRVCIDSAHDGRRQVYVVDVAQIVEASPDHRS